MARSRIISRARFHASGRNIILFAANGTNFGHANVVKIKERGAAPSLEMNKQIHKMNLPVIIKRLVESFEFLNSLALLLTLDEINSFQVRGLPNKIEFC